MTVKYDLVSIVRSIMLLLRLLLRSPNVC